jgi:hypothetical protein
MPWGLSGDQEIISFDTSFFRKGSPWNIQPGSDLYVLSGSQILMDHYSHNAPMDPNGNFLGRDDAGASTLWTYGEDEIGRYFGAPAGAKGSKPVFTLYKTYNYITGQEAYLAGSLTPAQLAGIVGTTTNNSANAGSVGEFITATVAAGSAVSLTTNTALNITTALALTAGDWDVSGVADFVPGATTNMTALSVGLGTTTNVQLTQTGGGGVGTDPLISFAQAAAVPGIGPLSLVMPPVRVLLSGPTAIYFVAKATFTVSTMNVYGTISARRVR